MVKIVKRRRQQEQQPDNANPDNIPISIFDALAPEDQVNQKDGKGKDAKGPSVEDLMKQVADLSTRLESAERAQAYTAAPVQAPVQTVQLKEPTFNIDNMPDPVAEPGLYAKAVAERTQQYTRDVADYQRKQAEATKPQGGGDPQALWEEFTVAHPEYIENEAQIKFAVSEASAKLARKGVDVNRYMYANSDRWFRDITREFDNVFGKPEEGDEAPAPREARRSRPVQTEEGDEGRTQGIFGGQDNGPKGRPSGPPVGDMIKDLHDIQRKSGYY